MSLWRKHSGRVAWGDGEPDTLAGKNAKAYREWSLWRGRGVECPDAWDSTRRIVFDSILNERRERARAKRPAKEDFFTWASNVYSLYRSKK